MQSKQDKMIEENIGYSIITAVKITGRAIKNLQEMICSDNKFKKMLGYLTLIGGVLTLIITVDYAIQIYEGYNPANNMLTAVFPVYVGFVIVGNILLLKIKNKLETNKIIKLNKGIRNRFESINFKDYFGKVPIRTFKEADGKYFEEHIFYSNKPKTDWEKNKSQIEEILNQRIISIKNDEFDTAFKIIRTSKHKEPKYVVFSKKYFSTNPYELFLGLDIYGQPQYLNLFDYPHTIISGGTNGGKSTTAYSFFVQLKQHSCNKIILCDFKQNTFKSLVRYNNNKQPIEDKKNFISMMEWAKKENLRRLALFKDFELCENLKEYNNLVPEEKKLKNIFIMIDELAIISDKKDEHMEELIKHIAQTGRSQGFYLLVLTQRPSAKTVPPEARANFMSRISSYQPDKITSEMAVGDDSATKLPDVIGRNIIKLAGKQIEIQMVHFKKEYLCKYLFAKSCITNDTMV